MYPLWAARSLVAVCVVAVSGAVMACAGTGGIDGPSARVTRVIDGDTVEMERLGKVRLIGVDTPEKKRCYEDAATRFTRDRLEGKVVRYELGEDREDRYDRTLAYLSRRGEMHNLDLLLGGYAKVLTISPNDKYAPTFERAEQRAETTDAGLWNTCDRDSIRARRVEARRRERVAEARRTAAAARRAERRTVRAAARARQQARRDRAATRRRQRQAQEDSPIDEAPAPETGGGADTSGPSTTNWCGKRDGDGDGIYCEGE